MLYFMFITLLSACSLQSAPCTATSTPCYLPVNLNCLFIHLSQLSSFFSFKQHHSSLFLFVLLHSVTVPSVPLCDYPSIPFCLFTLYALSLLVSSLSPHSTQATHTSFFAPSTPVCFRVYCYISHVSLYLQVLFICLFLVFYCNHSFIYAILGP
jgi:hypothetical protein